MRSANTNSTIETVRPSPMKSRPAISGLRMRSTARSASFTARERPSTTGYPGGGLNQPNWLVIDGSGNVRVANSKGNTVTELSNPGASVSPSTDYAAGGLNTPYGIAVDGSGNVWVTNSATKSTNVTELVGGGDAGGDDDRRGGEEQYAGDAALRLVEYRHLTNRAISAISNLRARSGLEDTL